MRKQSRKLGSSPPLVPFESESGSCMAAVNAGAGPFFTVFAQFVIARFAQWFFLVACCLLWYGLLFLSCFLCSCLSVGLVPWLPFKLDGQDEFIHSLVARNRVHLVVVGMEQQVVCLCLPSLYLFPKRIIIDANHWTGLGQAYFSSNFKFCVLSILFL